MRIGIAGDHAGFQQKQELVAFLNEAGHEVVDCGPANDKRVDYPDYAEAVACRVAGGQADFGVLICGTGVGMAMAANKIRGIRAANATSEQFAVLARQHNDANVLTLSGRFVSIEENKQILKAFLETPFEGGRHSARVAKIMALENQA